MSGINNNFDSSLSSSNVEDSQENEQNVNHSTHEAEVPLPPSPSEHPWGDTQSEVSDFLGSASRDSERASVEPPQGENPESRQAEGDNSASGGVSGKNSSNKVAQTNEKDSAHAARNELFQNRWQQIKKQGESSEIDTDNMHELHGFEQVANNASFETMRNVAGLMTFMHSMRNNPAVQQTGTLVDKISGGTIQKRTAEKYMRVIPHIFHAMAMSTDPNTKKMTAGAFRLAFTPNLVDGDEEAGKKGLETKEVRLIRDSIRRNLQKSGFNPNTGELVDKDRLKSIADAGEAAAQKQKDLFLNGFDTLSAQKEERSVTLPTYNRQKMNDF
jgi:hypothetical protein